MNNLNVIFWASKTFPSSYHFSIKCYNFQNRLGCISHMFTFSELQNDKTWRVLYSMYHLWHVYKYRALTVERCILFHHALYRQPTVYFVSNNFSHTYILKSWFPVEYIVDEDFLHGFLSDEVIPQTLGWFCSLVTWSAMAIISSITTHLLSTIYSSPSLIIFNQLTHKIFERAHLLHYHFFQYPLLSFQPQFRKTKKKHI